MKKRSRMLIAVALAAVLAVGGFFAGKSAAERKNSSARTERCCTLIKFAIDKAENGDLADEGTVKGLISNVYAAYWFCDDGTTANQLHDLWNYLIFESEGDGEAAKEIALQELNAALDAIRRGA